MLVIRRIQPTDEQALAAFFVACAADEETRRFFHPHPLTTAFAADLCRRIRGMRDQYLLAEHAERAVGYAILRGWDEGFAIPSFGGCVHPEVRNAGLGHVLLARCMVDSRARGAKSMRLTVARANERGVHLYRKFGFRLEPKGDDLVGMLALNAPAPQPAAPNFAALGRWSKSSAAA
jgi:ribosomal protein S18 acetylase RimI-like enzyme